MFAKSNFFSCFLESVKKCERSNELVKFFYNCQFFLLKKNETSLLRKFGALVILGQNVATILGKCLKSELS